MIRPLHVFLAFAALLFPAVAAANVPIPTLFGFIAPLWATLTTAGAAFAVIVVLEGVILSKVLPLSWRRALLLSLLMNVVSSILGILGSSPCLILPLYFLVPVFGYPLLRKRFKLHPVLCVVVLFLPLLWTFGAYNAALSPWVFWGSLIPGWMLTVLIEVVVVQARNSSSSSMRAVTLANLASYLVLVGMLLVLRIGPAENPMLSPDYFATPIVPKANRGDIEGVMEADAALREMYPESGYGGTRRLEAAEVLIESGHLHEAKVIVEGVKAQEEWDADFGFSERIRDIEKLLERASGEAEGS